MCVIAQFDMKCKQIFSVSQKSRLRNEVFDLGLFSTLSLKVDASS